MTSIDSLGANAMMQARVEPSVAPAGLLRNENYRRCITGMDIMPTFSEVASAAGPYLPADDPASWHLPGVSGRFDRLFRLLREESVGKVRDACRAYFDVCDDAKIHHIRLHETDGLQFIAELKQPEQVRHLTDRQRRDWWEHCNRFRSGTLVCVLDRIGYILHFVVPNSAPRLPVGSVSGPSKGNFSLSGNMGQAYVTLKLVDSSRICDALRYRATQGTHYCLDFPDVTLASFKYTLEALQYHYQSPRPHHLVSVLSPGPPISKQSPPVAVPDYARAAGFTFNLEPLMHNRQPFRFAPFCDPAVSEACIFADLGSAQSKALLESLSRQVALVGGLPKSGKTYLARKIIQVLLHNRKTAGIGPILFIFHDDSSLDRMIGQLLDDGIDGIVRMGSPSSSERLQTLNLPVTSYTGMSEQDIRAEGVMKEFLEKLESDIVAEFRHARFYELARTNKEYEDIRSELRHYHDDTRRQVLQDAHIVAATSTELSRYPELLQPIHAKILLCDDAHEFQESQILTAILPSTEHITLIGKDTVQNARPLDVDSEDGLDSSNASLFERLINSPPYRGPLSSHLHNLALAMRTLNVDPASNHAMSDAVTSVQLGGNMLNMMLALSDVVGEGRYQGLTALFIDTQEFSFGELRPREEVFQRVAGSIRRGNENSSSTGPSIETDLPKEPLFHLCGDLFGMDLLLRCNIVVLDDFLRLWRRDPAASANAISRPAIQLHLLSNFGGSQRFIRQAQEANMHIIAAQGHIYFAWYCGFALALAASTRRDRQSGGAAAQRSEFPTSPEEFRRSAEVHLTMADELYNISSRASRRLKDAIEATRDFVRSGNLGSLRVPRTCWYANTTGLFDGTGPWHFCDNGHPVMDVRQPPMLLGQLRCDYCGLTVAGREVAVVEEAPRATDEAVVEETQLATDGAVPPLDEDLIEL
ncbi:hypothetical protein DHEL01_v201499 [Diaporthe helianthi]|uniref:DNA2/NAM7 helicase helicase domain-containing protein n=1 Tax=Diaporthe helianthi TaxID=158607 RepID=A0A2P5IC46_DIAHE|nr:hypothetical protein DHEL01_v201499 [Diaporthe helianthi]